MSSSNKNWPEKGLCVRCLSEFIDWKCSQSCWNVLPSFLNCCPSNLLSGPTPSPFPMSMYSMWGCWVLLEKIFCRSLILCIWLDSEPTKFLDHSKQKPRRGGGLTQINICREVPFQVTFFRWRHFTIDFYESYLSTVHPFFYMPMCIVWNESTIGVIISIYFLHSFSSFTSNFFISSLNFLIPKLFRHCFTHPFTQAHDHKSNHKYI
jgi:hypothetical protein